MRSNKSHLSQTNPRDTLRNVYRVVNKGGRLDAQCEKLALVEPI